MFILEGQKMSLAILQKAKKAKERLLAFEKSHVLHLAIPAKAP
tara:strand:- start:521 stop:649 length:129 start_codon:yes stop_codon:yes gene_type:complete